MDLIAVDFPAPLGPAKMVISPPFASKLRSLQAGVLSYSLVRLRTCSIKFSLSNQPGSRREISKTREVSGLIVYIVCNNSSRQSAT